MTVTATTLDVDVSDIAPSGVDRMVADVFYETVPAHSASTPVVVCLPGGGMSRRYFDLHTAEADGAYSMARYLAAAGCVVVTVDPPGVGDSGRPADGYTLTPHVVADICAATADAILERLTRGTIATELAPLADFRTVGLGHSAGALLTVVQQARQRTYSALVLLGFHGRGLVDYLTEHERAYVDDPAGLRASLVSLTEARFGEPLPMGTNSRSALLIRGEPPAVAMTAIREATAPLLGLVGLTSLVPGSVSEELRVIDVPVFVGVGEYDITGPAHGIPMDFPASRDVTVFVLPDAGHNQNVAGNRAVLWQRVARWVAR
jgi:pimeloyl-ACP methyl ester carboxylesterase